VEISPASAENLSKLHVLIVDDEPLIRWSMAETLTHVGHTVSEAGSARETLQKVSDGLAPDVILLDFRLPDSNDLQLLETLRRMVPGSSVIMMTAFGTPEVIALASQLGAFRVIPKPIEMRDLTLLVQQAYAARTAA
jgi:two-component system NtrC family response regulator